MQTLTDARPPRDPKWLSRLLAATMFVVLGILHFVYPGAYVKIMPPIFPAPRLLVLISGAAEIAGGVGLLVPPLRRAAGWGLMLLLIAVFPANIYMAGWREQIGLTTPPIWLWLRLPLQFLIMAWVWDVGIRRSGRDAGAVSA